MKGNQVIANARTILQDAAATYWPDVEMLGWLNEGRLEVYRMRSDLFEVTATVDCAAGFRQILPGASRRLFEVQRNVSAPSQREITLVDSTTLARHRPNWRSMPAAAEILHFMYDPSSPTEFDIYPPARVTPVVQIEISYAALPAVLEDADLANDLVQEGEYAPALVDYLLYRSFLKEADTVPAFFQRAAQHLSACEATLQGAPQSQAAAAASQG